MTDFHDDDTRYWDDPPWLRSDRPIGDEEGGGERSGRLGQLVRDITGAIPRTGGPSFERTRTHHVVRRDRSPHVFEDASDDWGPVDHWLEPEPLPRPAGAAIDPRLLRIGAVGLAGVLLIPIALALREDDEALRGDQASVVTTTAAQSLPTPTTTVVAVAAPAPATPAPVAVGVAAIASPTAGDVSGSSASAEPACAGTYTVIPNDFWNRFPKTSGASVEEWLAANGATPDTPLYVGDELCIPLGATAPAPPPPTTVVATTAPPTTAAAAVSPPPTPAPAPPAPVATPAPAPVVTQPPAPVATPAPAPIPAGAPSTETLCGTLPTTNGNPPGTPGPAQVEAIIREIWPDDLEARALCIAKREAHLRADLSNWCCYGVFALYFDYLAADLRNTYGVDAPADLYDARTNVAIAYQVYLRSGWDPWSQTDPGTG